MAVMALEASGGPKTLRFCFGRSDDVDGAKSIPLGVEGVHQCRGSRFCKSNFECPTAFHWPEQSEKDHARCNLTQPDNRLQASHSVGLIYVYPEGPELSPKPKVTSQSKSISAHPGSVRWRCATPSTDGWAGRIERRWP